MYVLYLYIACYIIGVLVFLCALVKAFENRYQNELNYIDKEYNLILEKEIEKMKLKNNEYKGYDINKHLDYEYPNHNYHLLV